MTTGAWRNSVFPAASGDQALFSRGVADHDEIPKLLVAVGWRIRGRSQKFFKQRIGDLRIAEAADAFPRLKHLNKIAWHSYRRSGAIDGRPTSECNFANCGDISFRISSRILRIARNG
jgi:hypothetical protein